MHVLVMKSDTPNLSYRQKSKLGKKQGINEGGIGIIKKFELKINC